jgi:MFS family permease
VTDRNLAPERVRANFRLDLLSASFAGVFVGFVVPFMPVLVRRTGGSEVEVSLVIAAPFIGHLLSPLFVYLLSGLPPVPVVALTSTLARVVFLVGVLCSAEPLFVGTAYVGFWVLTLANIAAYTTLMQDIYPDEHRATAMGRVRIGGNLAGIITATIGGAVLQLTAEPMRVLAVATALSLVGSLAFFWIRHERPAAPVRVAGPRQLVKMSFADRAFRRYLGAFMVLGFGNLMGATIFPLLMVDRFDAPNAFIGVYAAISAASTMAGYAFWGRLIDRGSSVALTVANSALLIALPLGYLLAPNALFLLPMAVVTGFTVAGGDLTFITNMVQMAPRGRVSDYMAAQSFALGLRGTVAPFAASALLVAGGATSVLLIVLSLLTVGVAMLRGASTHLAPEATVAPAEPASAEAA